MKFTCSTEALNQAIMNVSLAVSPKSSLVALEGISISASDSSLSLAGYNLEMGITSRIEAKIIENGSVVIPAKIFSDIVKKTASETIEISCDSRFMVEIQGGVSHFTIPGTPPFEFPELPSVEGGESMRISQGKLASMIDQTLFAVAVSDAKPVHTGCLFLLQDGELTVVAVDGFRLAMRREKTGNTQELRFIVPGRSLSELLKLLSDNDDEVELSVSKKHILFSLGQTALISRLLEGDFLDYNAAIPRESSTMVTVSTRALLGSIERTSLLISDRLKSPVRVLFDQDSIIKMSCSTTMGKAYDECACSFSGKPVEIGFNNRYLIDALKNSQSDMVRLEIGGPLSPMEVLPVEGDSFLFLVLPMKLRNE